MTVQPTGIYSVIRAILTDDLGLTTDAVIARAKARGATQTDDAIRHVVHNVRSDLRGRKKPPAKGTKPLSAYTLAREALTHDPLLPTDDLVARLKSRGITKKDSVIREVIRKTRGEIRRKGQKGGAAPKPIPAPAAAVVTAPPAPAVLAADPFAGVRLANRTAHACGGIAKAREIAEAIRAVGGIDAFLERLDLVADILGSDTKM